MRIILLNADRNDLPTLCATLGSKASAICKTKSFREEWKNRHPTQIYQGYGKTIYNPTPSYIDNVKNGKVVRRYMLSGKDQNGKLEIIVVNKATANQYGVPREHLTKKREWYIQIEITNNQKLKLIYNYF